MSKSNTFENDLLLLSKSQFIYGLCNEHGQVIYIGKSANPCRRYREHLKIDRGFAVTGLCILEAVPADASDSDAERKWIAFFGRDNLSNKTNGGNGAWAYPISDATRAKIGVNSTGNHYALGYRHTEDARAKISAASKGNKYGAGVVYTEERKAVIRARMLGNTYSVGHKHTPEQCAKQGAVWKGRKRAPFTAEHREKLRLAKVGNKNRLGGLSYIQSNRIAL